MTKDSIQRALDEFHREYVSANLSDKMLPETWWRDFISSLLLRTRREVIEEIMERMPEAYKREWIEESKGLHVVTAQMEQWNAYRTTLLSTLKEMLKDNTKDI